MASRLRGQDSGERAERRAEQARRAARRYRGAVIDGDATDRDTADAWRDFVDEWGTYIDRDTADHPDPSCPTYRASGR